MNLKLVLRKYFPIILNFLCLAPRFWKNNSSYFVAVDYHYITSKQIQHPTLEVQSSILENQLMFFSESIDVINPKKFGDDYFQNKKSRLSLLITIDDADYSVKENLHLFEKYNIPILIFAPFGLCLDQNSRNGLISRILRAFFEIKDYSGNKEIVTRCFDLNLMMITDCYYSLNFLKKYYCKVLKQLDYYSRKAKILMPHSASILRMIIGYYHTLFSQGKYLKINLV